jgi:SM-20-related protein
MTFASVPLLDAVAAAHHGQLGGRRQGTGAVPGTSPRAARTMVLDEFLARPEMDALVRWVAGHEAQFGSSRVISPGRDGGQQNQGHRRSSVLYDPGPLKAMFEQRLMSVFDYVREALEQPAFTVRKIETQITASNDGEYFRPHTDNAHQLLTGRRLTYVYFFHREPARFSGGRLRLYDRRNSTDEAARGPLTAQVTPRQNQVVFFLPHYFHEIEAVSCPSRQFLDSRFTVNGWYWDS